MTCSHPWFPVWLLHPIPSPRLLPSLLFPFLSKSSVSPLQHSCSFIVNFGSAPSDLGCLPPLSAPALAAEILAVSVSPTLPLVPAPWAWSGLCQSPASCSATRDQTEKVLGYPKTPSKQGAWSPDPMQAQPCPCMKVGRRHNMSASVSGPQIPILARLLTLGAQAATGLGWSRTEGLTTALLRSKLVAVLSSQGNWRW